MPRRCTICSHEQTTQINNSVQDGQSFRSIALRYDLSHTAVIRHALNCLKTDYTAIDSQDKAVQIVDVKTRFQANLQKAEKWGNAADKWLTVNGETEIDPRAHEVEVIYTDQTEKTALKWPKQRKATLQSVIDWIKQDCQGKIKIERVSVKTMDPRKFALDSLDKIDMCLNRFAMIFGEYTSAKENPANIQQNLISYMVEYAQTWPELTQEQYLEAAANFIAGATTDKVKLDLTPAKLAQLAGVQVIEGEQ